ncbi:hypothetical protein TWF694_010590 [Orbilia ellipsospora]|uniref:Bud22 domain-containing protein n=1 Tax=Orbilia ellipsospora TaxID=2528407 RepID=A0AAV9XB93_9PEZI
MPKRKRSDFEPFPKDAPIPPAGTDELPEDLSNPEESSRSIAIQQQTIEQKIHHHRILLKRALKTAKGFEQQKLGKRIKSARKGRIPPSKGKDGKDGKDEVERLDKELEELKNVDLQELATTYLNKTLLKNRQLSTSKYFPSSVVKEAEEHSKLPVPTGPTANVCARLLNANPVKEAVKEILGNLGRLLGAEGGEETTAQTKEAKSKERTESKPVMHGKSEHTPKDSSSDDDSESESEEADILDDNDEVVHPSMLKNLATKYLQSGGAVSSEDDEEDEELDERIAWSSADDDNDSDDVSGQEDDRPRGRSMSITPIPEDELRAMEAAENENLDIPLCEDEDEAETDDNTPSLPSKKPQPKKQSQKQALPLPPSGPITASSFLPTLMTGYISGSDSDASSTSSTRGNKKKKTGPPAKKARKNRMGQQARRALAEKKYGTSANHVKKAKEEKEAKLKAKEERKKAWADKQNKPVHVSWQLKKKEKDEKDQIVRNMMAGKTAGAGKKIVFD